AEDGIRDGHVTGVQTCALPICAWVFSGGLNAPSTATVLRPGGGEVLITDGPFAEGKEYLGGFTIITAPDLDSALDWGRKLARAKIGRASCRGRGAGGGGAGGVA